MKRKRNNQGFTLVELMVVAIIVAILAAVAIPLMTANKRRAIATEAEAGCGTIRTALRIYYAEHNSYPTGGVQAATALVGIGDGDLDGTYFSQECYTFDPAAETFVIEADGDSGNTAPKEADAEGIVITLDHDGNWTRTGV
jgi:prepilin-type N-terminal cleavage/methylation domain-containing protein